MRSVAPLFACKAGTLANKPPLIRYTGGSGRTSDKVLCKCCTICLCKNCTDRTLAWLLDPVRNSVAAVIRIYDPKRGVLIFDGRLLGGDGGLCLPRPQAGGDTSQRGFDGVTTVHKEDSFSANSAVFFSTSPISRFQPSIASSFLLAYWPIIAQPVVRQM